MYTDQPHCQTIDSLRASLACAIALVMLTNPAQSAVEPELPAFTARQSGLRALGDRTQTVKVRLSKIMDAGFEALRACEVDSDGDGLSDCIETDDGQFISATSTGTDPLNPDTDGDGLSDGEEVLGTETGLDLRALGVHPLRRDLLVEIDWFVSEYDCGLHSQRPTAASVQRLVSMFAAASTLNADGSTGINVIIDSGQGGLLTGGNRITGYDAILPGSMDKVFHEIKQANFAPSRLGYFRYVMMPHRYDGGSASSGAAEIVGDDAIVSLYCLNTESNVTRTLAHEIGHMLGLLHGGFEHCNRKPNYNSLMNYRFQFTGTDANCDALGDITSDDMSRGTRLMLDELALNELEGVCGTLPVDWNRDDRFDLGLIMDLNPGEEDRCGGALVRLHDFDDWSNLTFIGLADRTGTLKSIQTQAFCPRVQGEM
ncbi:hypothetical protein [Pseudomarimonas salicorniae]|uniref:Peptidase M43 pregnancy-associated plasma-A domain-containing protein n=1 Tax=Pseudomarimonas salicorniae TaxID=2933270 RepID=A0ABT0GEM6_9GAMM|nr:hypothetical protein [Lysobacter sp. CAU 1642]MCK7592888.1 hypothetical protein [Lysobacter sp. CAU 1642]